MKIDERRAVLEAWATAHKAEHFTTARRSLSLTHAIIGFRLSKPRLVERPPPHLRTGRLLAVPVDLGSEVSAACDA